MSFKKRIKEMVRKEFIRNEFKHFGELTPQQEQAIMLILAFSDSFKKRIEELKEENKKNPVKTKEDEHPI